MRAARSSEAFTSTVTRHRGRRSSLRLCSQRAFLKTVRSNNKVCLHELGSMSYFPLEDRKRIDFVLLCAFDRLALLSAVRRACIPSTQVGRKGFGDCKTVEGTQKCSVALGVSVRCFIRLLTLIFVSLQRGYSYPNARCRWLESVAPDCSRRRHRLRTPRSLESSRTRSVASCASQRLRTDSRFSMQRMTTMRKKRRTTT